MLVAAVVSPQLRPVLHPIAKCHTLAYNSARVRDSQGLLADMQEAGRAPADVLVLDIEAGPPEVMVKAMTQYRITTGDKIRVILLAPGRQPGDQLVAALVGQRIYDILIDTDTNDLMTALGRALASPPAQYIHAAKWITFTLEESQLKPSQAALEPPERASAGPQGGITTVIGLGPPGGGATTIAANLAAVWAQAGQDVTAVDLNPDNAALAAFFGLEEEDALTQIVQGAQPDSVLSTAYGLKVAGGPLFPARPPAAALTEASTIALIDRLGGHGKRLVIDGGSSLIHPATIVALRIASEVIVVVDLDPHRIWVAAQRLQVLEQLTQLSKAKLAINKTHDEISSVTAREAAEAIGSLPYVEIPLVPRAPDAISKGQPLAMLLGHDVPYTVAIRRLAGIDHTKPRRRRWLF